jgi:hypothetical protein
MAISVKFHVVCPVDAALLNVELITQCLDVCIGSVSVVVHQVNA